MYIQDEKQMIRGNLDIPGNWDEQHQTSQMWTLVVILPEIGAFVTYQGKSYVIISTVTYQEQSDEIGKSVITTICDLLRINNKGKDMGEPTIKVRATDLALI